MPESLGTELDKGISLEVPSQRHVTAHLHSRGTIQVVLCVQRPIMHCQFRLWVLLGVQ